jgi:methionine-rich copper-binding protein CopC
MNGNRSGASGIRLALIALSTFAFILAPCSVLAHARLVKSLPAINSEIAQPVTQIDIWFNELLDNGFNSIDVFPAGDMTSQNRRNLALEDAKVDPKDRTHLTLALKPLPPGDYVVEWRVLSLDGRTAPGRFRFRIRAAK